MTARTKEALCCDFRAHDFVGRWVSLSFLSQKLVVPVTGQKFAQTAFRLHLIVFVSKGCLNIETTLGSIYNVLQSGLSTQLGS